MYLPGGDTVANIGCVVSVLKLCRTYGRILDFSFGGRTENRYEMALEMVSGAAFRGVLHHLLNLTRLKAYWGQVWPENSPKPKLKSRFEFPNLSPSQERFLNGLCCYLDVPRSNTACT